MIIIHFMIFEQELLFCFLLLFGLHSNAVYVFIIILILILLVDLLLGVLYVIGIIRRSNSLDWGINKN